ncbi:hypothetical protein ABZW03_06515 [Kitasatospora sp. NPDC004799]|uniref:hypothetical protein n=1 Tax=Kitasatospora sp. NPDC004799 TaxID=3154460 RepID=UPI0033B92C15
MPQHHHAPARITRVCPDCNGFARAAVATGTRLPDGTRTTLHTSCRTCEGTVTVTRHTAAAAQL